MGFFSDDIVQDILARVVRAAQSGGGFDDAMAEQIERQVRADWGAQRPYIAADRQSRTLERNEKIHAIYWDEGQRDLVLLSRRFGLSTKQIRRIVGR